MPGKDSCEDQQFEMFGDFGVIAPETPNICLILVDISANLGWGDSSWRTVSSAIAPPCAYGVAGGLPGFYQIGWSEGGISGRGGCADSEYPVQQSQFAPPPYEACHDYSKDYFHRYFFRRYFLHWKYW